MRKDILKDEKPKIDFDDDANHLSCFSYPVCDLNPLGCLLLNNEPEEFGFKD